MTQRQCTTLRVALIGVTAIYVACAGSGPRPDFTHDFRLPDGLSARTAWFRMLATRYECDTVLVSLASRRPGRLGTGMTACAAAERVTPEVVSAWIDSTGVQEVWDYFGSRNGNSGVVEPTRYPGGRCTVTLKGRDPRSLLVSEIAC